MTVLVVPDIEDDEPWPTLGRAVASFIEAFLVFGPGDLRGEPARLDDEKRGLLYRAYEVYPPVYPQWVTVAGTKKRHPEAGQKHPFAGRRRFRRVALSLRKGSAKTELAAWIAAAELHPDGPVRADGFDASGRPVGRGVVDPYIPMVAYTEGQADALAYTALYVALSEGPLANDFDIGLGRIMRKAGDGKAEALSSAPSSRDGARTTWQHFDETHRWILPRHKMAHRTMLANLPKRVASDAWALETTTAPSPGEGSVAEATHRYAEAVEAGRVQDSRLFFFHRQASESRDITTREGLREAVLEASGPVASWSNIEAIVDQFAEPDADLAYLERVWLNRLVRSAEAAFDVEAWRRLRAADHHVPEGSLITLGFDGSRYRDATAIVATEVVSGYQWLAGVWERPPNQERWEVPETEVDAVIGGLFRTYDVWRLYADPPYWEGAVARWAGEYGAERVIAWRTNRIRQMAYATLAFANAIQAGDLSHEGDRRLEAHVGHAQRQYINLWDDPAHEQDVSSGPGGEKRGGGRRLWLITKDRNDSIRYIDAAVAAVLSWEARRDAVAAGMARAVQPSVYERAGITFIG